MFRARWPQTNDSKEWELVNKDVSLILNGLRGNAMGKQEKMGKIIYS